MATTLLAPFLHLHSPSRCESTLNVIPNNIPSRPNTIHQVPSGDQEKSGRALRVQCHRRGIHESKWQQYHEISTSTQRCIVVKVSRVSCPARRHINELTVHRPIEILIPSRKHEREEDPENEIQKKARNHNTSEPVGPSKRRDWSDNPEPTTKAKFDAVIRKLLARRASRSRCPTAIEREQIRIEILEADPCVEWFTLVSVMCAGCHREFSMDGRQGYYRKLWEKHRDYSCPGSKQIMAGHERRHRYDEAARWMVSRSAM
jgi:hypothetical protein